MTANSPSSLERWSALPGEDTPSVEEVNDFINLAQHLGGERGLLNTCESARIHLTHNGLRLITHDATRSSVIGSTQFVDGTAGNSD
eukprot:3856730-Amphidinium_carterae.1